MHLFEELKRKYSSGYQERTLVKDFNFLIALDEEQGAYIETIDKKGNPVTVDHRLYSGSTREVLRMLEEIQDKNSFMIDWDNPHERIYLAHHEYLLYSGWYK